MQIYIGFALVVVVASVALALVLRRLIGPSSVAKFDPAWFGEFSVAKYRPMLRLLADTDYKFLSSQVGYDPKMVRKLRSERRRIFRAYLRNIERDFHRLQLTAKLMVVYSGADRSALVEMLFRQRIVFAFALVAVEFRLALHGLGLGAVDVRGLVAALEQTQLKLTALVPAQPAAAA